MRENHSPESLLNVLKTALPNLCPLTTKQQLLTVQSNLTNQIRDLMREVRINATNKNAEANRSKTSQLLTNARRIATWVEFSLHYCDDKKKEEYCFYSLTLEWLLNSAKKPDVDKATVCQEINEVLNAFFNDNVENAFNYYSSQSQFAEYPTVKVQVNQTLVQYYLNVATKLLSLQSPPSGIIPLLSTFFEAPHQFAAMLIWAINQGITPDELIRSSLLHHFVTYHLSDIGQENNPVAQVFNWLTALNDNKGINELILKAQSTSCEQRGFKTYSLTGEVRKKNEAELQKVKSELPELSLSLADENILNLYQCFGPIFLEKAIGLLSRTANPQLKAALQTLFKESAQALEQLSPLMNLFFRERDVVKKERLFKGLAMVVSDELAKKLLTENTAILSLIAYKPSLATEISEDNLEQFVKRIITSSEISFDVLAQLIVLLNFLKNKKSPLAKLLFENILEIALSSGESSELVRNDDAFHSQLSAVASLYFNADFFAQKIDLYHQALNDFILAHTNEPLTIELYDAIEYEWRDQLKRVNLLKSMGGYSIKIGGYPLDKYMLKTAVIMSCYKQYKLFDLTQSINAITKQYQDIEQTDGEKERTYIELLLAADDDELLVRIIDVLDNILKIVNWQNKEYGDKDLIFRAIEQESLAFLRHLAKNLLANPIVLFDAQKGEAERVIASLKPKINKVLCQLADAGKLKEHWTKVIIKDCANLSQVLMILPVNDWPVLFNMLGDDYIKTIIASEETLAAVLSDVPAQHWPNLLDLLSYNYIKCIIYNEYALAKILKNLAEDHCFYFLSLFDKDYIKSEVKSSHALATILNALPINDWSEFLDILGNDHIKTILDASDNLAEILKRISIAKWPSVLALLGNDRIKIITEKIMGDYYYFPLFVHGFSKDELLTIFDILSNNNIKNIIKDHSVLVRIVKAFAVDQRALILDKLGNDYIKVILDSSSKLANVLYYFSVDEWPLILDRLGDDYIKEKLIQSPSALVVCIERLPVDEWTFFLDRLGADHLKTIIGNWSAMADILYCLPPDGWLHIFNRLGKVHMETLFMNAKLANILWPMQKSLSTLNRLDRNLVKMSIKHHVDLALVLKCLFARDWPHFIASLGEDFIKALPYGGQDCNPMEPIAAAQGMQTYCKLMPAQLLLDCGTNKVRELISNNFSTILSTSDFDRLMREQLCFRRGLNYLTDQYTQLLQGKIMPLSFNTRIDDFCKIITLLADFLSENKGKNPLDADLKKHIQTYTNSQAGLLAVTNINKTSSRSFLSRAFLNDPYISHRNFLVNINFETLSTRLEEFQDTIFHVASDDATPSSRRMVAQRIQQAFMGPELTEEKQQDQATIEMAL